jgi:hypothetical protein
VKKHALLIALLSISAMAQADTKAVAMIPIPLKANSIVNLHGQSCHYFGEVVAKKDGTFEMVIKNKACGQTMTAINVKIALTEPVPKGREVTISE